MIIYRHNIPIKNYTNTLLSKGIRKMKNKNVIIVELTEKEIKKYNEEELKKLDTTKRIHLTFSISVRVILLLFISIFVIFIYYLTLL